MLQQVQEGDERLFHGNAIQSYYFQDDNLVASRLAFFILAMDEVNLKRIWEDFCADKLQLSHDLGGKIWAVIEAKYNESVRSYHTLQHIEDLVQLLQLCKSRIVDLDTVLLAIFFHDVIYDPTASDNEEKSAALFSDLLSVHVSECIIQKVVLYIMATKSHSSDDSRDEDLFYFLDLDMSILGRDRLQYALYAEKIRKEYSHVEEGAFNLGRSIFLRKILLNGKKIFLTEEFQSKMEEKARHNIAWEIDELERKNSNMVE